MSAHFDAYHRWLGISSKDQPPNHYRLLGVDVFEADPDVIASAADQRMTHVRTFQTGQHSHLSQQILNEIAQARICLLNAEKKADYDRQLRPRLEPAVRKPPPIPSASTAPVSTPWAIPLEPRAASQPEPQPGLPTFSPREHPRRRSRSWQFPVAIGGAAIILALVVGIFAVSNTSQDAGEREVVRTLPPPAAEPEPPLPVPEEERPADVPTEDTLGHEPIENPSSNIGGKLEGPVPPDVIPGPATPEKPAGAEGESAPQSETVEAAAERLREQFARSQSEADFKSSASALLGVCDRAIAAGNTTLANDLIALALIAARTSKDTELIKIVTLRAVELQGSSGEVQQAVQKRLKQAGVPVEAASLPGVGTSWSP